MYVYKGAVMKDLTVNDFKEILAKVRAKKKEILKPGVVIIVGGGQ